MVLVKFKNLERSELAREATAERLEAVVKKFPDLARSAVEATLEMQNSPFQAGPDVFGVKVHVKGGRYGDLRIEKSNSNLYAALAEVVDRMLERLNRFGDRARAKERNRARKVVASIAQRRPSSRRPTKKPSSLEP